MALKDSLEFCEEHYGKLCIQHFGENDFDFHAYEFLFLKKDDYRENDIFQVHYRNKSDLRLGWLFPIDTAFSIEHDFKDNPHYAFYINLLSLYFKEAFNTEDFYEFTNFHTLILKKESMEANGMSSSLDIICSIARSGYYYLESEVIRAKGGFNFDSCYENLRSDFVLEEARNSGVLTVKSAKIGNFDYLIPLLKYKLRDERNYFLRFILIYQIHEYLMENKFYEKIEGYRQSKFNLGTVRNKIIELNTEKKLINKVFNDSGFSNDPSTFFLDSCKVFLEDFKEEEYFLESQNTSTLIYDVRNILIHNFHKYTKDEETIKPIVDEFEKITLDLLEHIY